MTGDDIAKVLEIENASFNTPWSRTSFLNELGCKYSRNYVLRCAQGYDNTQIIAYICFRMIENEMQLLKIATAPGWRRQGAAARLIRDGMQLAKDVGACNVFLEVRPSNTKAIAFYKSFDFVIIGKRPNYYADTREDAFVMSCDLSLRKTLV
jgi:ribosomal-protein-alanine N-acetyltransferase